MTPGKPIFFTMEGTRKSWTKAMLPCVPYSSRSKRTRRMLNLGRQRAVASARASSRTAAVPEALSLNPFVDVSCHFRKFQGSLKIVTQIHPIPLIWTSDISFIGDFSVV